MAIIERAPLGRKVDVDALLARVDLAAIATKLIGPPPGRRGERGRKLWWHCPFHEDANPSLCIDPGKRWWNCYGCKASGTAIDLMTRLGGLGFLDACRALAGGAGHALESIGLGPETAATATPRHVSARVGSPSKSGLPNGPRGLAPKDALSLVDRASAALWTPEGAGSLDYLRRRGLADATIRAARLGWTDWICVPRSDGTVFRSRGLVIPWLERRRLSLVKLRPPEGRVGPKYVEAFRDDPTLYTAAPIRPGRPLAIVEGEIDALTVGQEASEWVGVVTLGSASGRVTPAAISGLALATPWYIATDGDDAGDKAALDWLTPYTARCVRVRPPEGLKDWNEMHARNPGVVRCIFARLAGGPDALWSVLEPLRWGRAGGPEDEPPDILAGEPPPDLREG